MVVVATVGILAAIAIPAYLDYMIRGRVSEALAAAAECKTRVSELAQVGAAATLGLNEDFCAGTTAATQFVKEVGFVMLPPFIGLIAVALSNDTKLGGAAGGFVVLSVKVSDTNDRITGWGCYGEPVKYMPANCRDPLDLLTFTP